MSIPAIAHIIPTHVTKSVNDLEFDLSQWDQNPRIGGLLSRSVLAGGKRLRPLVSFLMADFFGIDHSTMAPYARVVELVHAATLAHDDVIDNAEVRRGLPSINAVASNKKAVLSGDYLLAYAVDEVAKQGELQIVRCLTKVISDLAEGEWLQIENTERSDLRWEHIVSVSLKKTGSVLRWCSQVPSELADVDDSIRAKAASFGEKLGIAFQMTDDILDFKRRDGAEFADLKNGVINAVIFEMMQSSGQLSTSSLNGNLKLKIKDNYLEEAINRVASYSSSQLNDCRNLLDEMAQNTEHLKAENRGPSLEALQSLVSFIEKRV